MDTEVHGGVSSWARLGGDGRTSANGRQRFTRLDTEVHRGEGVAVGVGRAAGSRVVIVRDWSTKVHREQKTTSELLSWREDLEPFGRDEPGFNATNGWRTRRKVPDDPSALFLRETPCPPW